MSDVRAAVYPLVMLAPHDFQAIGLYLVLLAVIGWSFRRFTGNVVEYFTGGRRMTWWLLGADSFQSNFSCWVFTGAAGVAYTQGALIFGFYLVDVLAFALAYLWFAKRFRQLRVVTAIDAVRLRFGARDEKFFAVLSVIASLSFASLRVLGLTVLLSSGFDFPTILVIGLTVAVVVFVALFGGSWAVAAMNLVQLVIIVSVTVMVAVLAVIRVGGWPAFVAQIPPGHWEIFKPIGTSSYDWLFVVSGLLGASYAKNNLLVVSKYAPADDAHGARKSSLIPLIGYVIMPAVWMIPAFAAFTLVPDLLSREGVGQAGEWAYISVCTTILPSGLLGLVVVCMLATTISSVGVALNINAGTLTQNIYLPWRAGRASPTELVFAGKVVTLILGIVIGGGCLLLASSKVSLFDALLYLGAYVSVPATLPLFLGLFIRGEPWWAARATVVFSAALTIALFHGLPALLAAWTPPPTLEGILSYLSDHRFVATNLLVAPSAALFFYATTRWSKSSSADERLRQQAFFTLINQPLPAAEKAPSTQAQPHRLIGRFMAGAAGAIVLIALPADSNAARLSILGCALLPVALAIGLLLSARHKHDTSSTSRRPA